MRSLCVWTGWKDTYEKLLQFITTTHYYDVDRLYGHLTSEGTLPSHPAITPTDSMTRIQICTKPARFSSGAWGGTSRR